MGMPYKIILFVIFTIFLIRNFAMIAKKRIDAGVGVFWAVVLIVFLIMDFVADLRALSRINQIVATALTSLFVCAGFIMYSHEVQLTELKKKNNELAIQIALINDDIRRLTEQKELQQKTDDADTKTADALTDASEPDNGDA